MEHLDSSESLTLESLRQRLEEAGIDTSRWGRGRAKTLEQLLTEVEKGEASLVTLENGELTRTVSVINADVLYLFSPGGEVYKLKEAVQVFNDGHTRERGLPHAVSEKIKPSEYPEAAMERGLREELGLEGEIIWLPFGIEEKIESSRSYPGLQTRYILHKFEVALTDEQYNPDGYIEKQEDKSTYFVWQVEQAIE